MIEIKLNNICKINNIAFPDKYKDDYLKSNFNISYNDYIIKYYLNNAIPVCKCGCNTRVKFKIYNNILHIPEYTSNHFPRKKHSNKTKLKIKTNTKNAIIKKFGVDNVFKLSRIKNKSLKTKYKKYGNSKYNNPLKNSKTQQKKFYKKLITSNRLTSEYIPMFKLEDFDGVKGYKKYKFKHTKCNKTFYDYIDNGSVPKCKYCYPITASKYENEIYSYVKKIVSNNIVLRNDKSILTNMQELDIYVPHKKVAIEFNGLYWHSELSGHKNKKYHITKTKLCYNKGIKLIHIFEDEWINKKNIIKSIIKKNLSDDNIRNKYKIREITIKEKNQFLNKYHLEGKDNASIKIGAFYYNTLISVMTLLKKNDKNEYYINRFCTKHNNDFILNLMINYITSNCAVDKIISISDRRFFSGNSYINNGFKYIKTLSPRCWYMDNYKLRYKRKRINNKDKIWDCGYAIFEYEKEKALSL